VSSQSSILKSYAKKTYWRFLLAVTVGFCFGWNLFEKVPVIPADIEAIASVKSCTLHVALAKLFTLIGLSVSVQGTATTVDI